MVKFARAERKKRANLEPVAGKRLGSDRAECIAAYNDRRIHEHSQVSFN